MSQEKPTTSKNNKTKNSVFSWSISPTELKYQLENYSTLGITQSYRGIAVLFVLALMAFTIVLSFFGVVPLDSSTIIEAIIYCVALYFVYQGHRWAIILVMLLWTGDKAVSLYDVATTNQSGSVVTIIIWWLIVMPYLYKALRIENERRKLQPVAVSIEDSVYCSECGSKQDKDAKFCVDCGKKIAEK